MSSDELPHLNHEDSGGGTMLGHADAMPSWKTSLFLPSAGIKQLMIAEQSKAATSLCAGPPALIKAMIFI